jgi:hypothetical protein
MDNEDITQDPEYIKGYERGIETRRREQSKYTKGFIAGYSTLKPPRIIDSEPIAGITMQEWQRQIEERLRKLEELYGTKD